MDRNRLFLSRYPISRCAAYHKPEKYNIRKKPPESQKPLAAAILAIIKANVILFLSVLPSVSAAVHFAT
jgi:hypothetical protein